MFQLHGSQVWQSVPTSEEQDNSVDVPLKARHADTAPRTRQPGLLTHHALGKQWRKMDSIIGGLSNLRVDTVLSAVDKYVLYSSNHLFKLASFVAEAASHSITQEQC